MMNSEDTNSNPKEDSFNSMTESCNITRNAPQSKLISKTEIQQTNTKAGICISSPYINHIISISLQRDIDLQDMDRHLGDGDKVTNKIEQFRRYLSTTLNLQKESPLHRRLTTHNPFMVRISYLLLSMEVNILLVKNRPKLDIKIKHANIFTLRIHIKYRRIIRHVSSFHRYTI